MPRATLLPSRLSSTFLTFRAFAYWRIYSLATVTLGFPGPVGSLTLQTFSALPQGSVPFGLSVFQPDYSGLFHNTIRGERSQLNGGIFRVVVGKQKPPIAQKYREISIRTLWELI